MWNYRLQIIKHTKKNGGTLLGDRELVSLLCPEIKENIPGGQF